MATISISLSSQITTQIDYEVEKIGFATRSEFIRDILRRYFSKQLEFEIFEPQSLQQVKLDLAKSGKYNQKFIESIISGLKQSSIYGRKTTQK